MKTILLDLIRATEAAAISASHFIGSGDKKGADAEATRSMRERLNAIDFSARVVIGEGKKDQSDGLFDGELVGANRETVPPEFDLAIDPIDGTRPTVQSGPEAMSVIALGTVGSMWFTEEYYMNKLAFGPALVGAGLSLSMDLGDLCTCAARQLGKPLNRLMVCMLDRPRHAAFAATLRKMGVRIRLIQDCDISGAIATCTEESGVDLLYGAGGAPESVITACAIRCLGGGFKAQVVDADCNPKGGVMDATELATGPCAFAATGITTGSLLKGVRFTRQGPVTHSVVMRSASGTTRWITTRHGNR
jgi:fructose-1,6-bisphosphatase/sedoheptulose 1,7-bisphosphatase-like protein